MCGCKKGKLKKATSIKVNKPKTFTTTPKSTPTTRTGVSRRIGGRIRRTTS